MSFKFVILSKFSEKDEFYNTIKSELEIYKQLVIKENFEMDSDGDIVFDENKNPKVISENKGSEFKLNYNKSLNGKSNLIKSDDYDGYSDVFGLDECFLPKNVAILYSKDQISYYYGIAKLLICYNAENIYQGSTWIIEDKKYIAMYGIRTSFNNYFNNVRGTATIILKKVIKMAGKRTVLVPWPLKGMIPLLKKFNFKEFNVEKMNSQRKFLSQFTFTINYWELKQKSSILGNLCC